MTVCSTRYYKYGTGSVYDPSIRSSIVWQLMKLDVVNRCATNHGHLILHVYAHKKTICMHTGTFLHNGIDECTKVQNPQQQEFMPQTLLRLIMRMRTFCRKMADCTLAFKRRECWISATGQVQRKFHKFWTSVARRVHDSIFRMNRRSRREMRLNRETHRHNQVSYNSRCTFASRLNNQLSPTLLFNV